MTPPNLEELRALLEKATPGPWDFFSGEIISPDHDDVPTVVGLQRHNRGYLSHDTLTLSEADAALIVAAVNALPALLDAAAEVETLRKERDAAREALDSAEVARRQALLSLTQARSDLEAKFRVDTGLYVASSLASVTAAISSLTAPALRPPDPAAPETAQGAECDDCAAGLPLVDGPEGRKGHYFRGCESMFNECPKHNPPAKENAP